MMRGVLRKAEEGEIHVEFEIVDVDVDDATQLLAVDLVDEVGEAVDVVACAEED